VHAQQARESTRTTCTRSKQGKGRCSYWWRTLGWQKNSMPTSRKSSTNSCRVALMFMVPPKHTQAKVECAGPLHAAVCSSALQCLEPLPPPPIVRVATQDHPVHLLAATQHGCAQSKQKHESANVRCVSPLCAAASRSAARAIPICPPLCRCCAIFHVCLFWQGEIVRELLHAFHVRFES